MTDMTGILLKAKYMYDLTPNELIYRPSLFDFACLSLSIEKLISDILSLSLLALWDQ